MKIKVFLFVVAFTSLSNLSYSQSKIKRDIINKNATVSNYGVTSEGNYYVLDLPNKKYRVWDQNLEPILDLQIEKKISKNDFGSVNTDGKVFTFYRNGILNFSNNIESEDISPKKYWIHKYILTKNRFVLVAQEWLKSDKQLSKFLLLNKNLITGKLEKSPFKIPNNYELDVNFNSIESFNSDSFKMVFSRKNENDGSSNYKLVTYSYSGNILNEVEVSQSLDDFKNQKFQNVNLVDDSEYYAYDRINDSGAHIPLWFRGYSGAIPLLSSSDIGWGTIKEELDGQFFYSIVGLNQKKGDSGILLQKFDTNGKLIWRKVHILDNTTFPLINSANRFLSIKVYDDFIGVMVYSYKGKKYCDFYLIDKNTGDIITNKKFDKYRITTDEQTYRPDGLLFNLKTKDFSNLLLQESVVFYALKNDDFFEFLLDLNSKGNYTVKGINHSGGINIIALDKKKSNSLIATFNK